MNIKFPTMDEFAEQLAEQTMNECKYKGKTLKQWIDEIIQYEEENKWIPVEEGFPKDREWYLVLFKEPDTGFIGIPYIADYLGRKTKATTNDGWIIRNCTDNDMVNCDYYKSLECVAWRPLPELYKPEQKTKDAQRQRDTEEFFTEYQEGEENNE